MWDLSLGTLPQVLKAVANGALMLDAGPDDGVVARSLFSYQLLPGFFGVNDYEPLLEKLRAAVPQEQQLLTFPYDWRGSNAHAASALAAMALPKLHAWRRSTGLTQAKLWLVCHSMGGLVARYFCEALGGAECTRAVVTFGTPHRGAMKALDKLVNGMRLVGMDLSASVRSLSSVYELLPLYRAVLINAPANQFEMRYVADFFDLDPVSGKDTQCRSRLGPLPNLEPERLRCAIKFHRAIRVRAQARSARGKPCPYRLEAFINRRQVTPAAGRWTGDALEVLDELPRIVDGTVFYENRRGDGTVPSFAAVPIEWPSTDHALVLQYKHAAAHAAPVGIDTLLNWLWPDDVRELMGNRDDEGVALETPAAIEAGDELVVYLSSPRPIALDVYLTCVGSGAQRKVPTLTPGGEMRIEVGLGTLDEGTYRVRAAPLSKTAPPIDDYVVVIAT